MPRCSATSGAKQYINRAGAAVDRSGGGKCHDVHMPAQPESYHRFEDRPACSRAMALAVHNSHATTPGVAAAGDELRKLIACCGLVQPVKIEFILCGI